MNCRVGITTDPESRKRFWMGQYPHLRTWQILGTHRSKSEAQRQENFEAQRRGCVAHPGGAGSEYATWYVYFFEF